MKFLLSILLLLLSVSIYAQTRVTGVLTGTILDEKKKALEGASLQLFSIVDSTKSSTTLSDKNGSFTFFKIEFGLYRLQISYVGHQLLTIDSLNFRADRYDFNLNDITLRPKSSDNLNEVIVYSEKPLIQSKEGNITFNAGESALSAGSTTSELLTNVPLVTKDPSGKLLVRGKEPKILIDDKPVELNQQQLQDLLESMSGSSIEKIEVMTNPPPQYANEQGGVINITTKKGKVGKSGRVTLSAGTRGESSINSNFNYRKQGFTINITAGFGYNTFQNNTYSNRANLYKDSINFFQTEGGSDNKNFRPNLRANIDYELNKKQALNIVLNYNQNGFDNENNTEFRNLNRMNDLYRLSRRIINGIGENYNPGVNLTYTLRTKRPGEVLRIISQNTFSANTSNRKFYQQFLQPDYTFWYDSTQRQINSNDAWGHTNRLNYDVPLSNKKTSFSLGGFYTINNSKIEVDAAAKGRAREIWEPLPALTNELRFKQYITNIRGSFKQVFGAKFSITAGLAAEATKIEIDLYTQQSGAGNRYWSLLPFATFNKNWKEVLNLTASYRRTIRRPGIGELNPTIDFSDPYNLRYGNPELLPSLAHTIDLVLGKTKKSFYLNLGVGYNEVEDIFSQIRNRVQDITHTTWQNINNRKEYEVSTWSGITASKKLKINLSASYTYNQYASISKDVKFRDGGSFTSNMNTNYIFTDRYNATGSFTFNRFANPQGSVRSNLSMNMGLQAKMLEKKMTLTLNIIDPLRQQQNRTFTYGSNFTLENYSSTQTRNIRLTASYNLTKTTKKSNLRG